MDISGTHLRAVRAALFTAVVVTLGTASHVLLSGVPLPLTTVAAITAAVFLVAYALAGRARGFGRIAGVLIPLELTADTAFTAGQHACYGEAGGPVIGVHCRPALPDTHFHNRVPAPAPERPWSRQPGLSAGRVSAPFTEN